MNIYNIYIQAFVEVSILDCWSVTADEAPWLCCDPLREEVSYLDGGTGYTLEVGYIVTCHMLSYIIW